MGRDNRQITCVNNSNMSIILGDEFNPFLLTDVDGLYEMAANVATNENGMLDGSSYVGSLLKERNIVLTIKDKSEHASNRNFLYLMFKPKSLGKLTYYEKDGDYKVKRSIDYHVESVTVTGTKGVRTSVISLICPDPYYTDDEDTEVSMTAWDDGFEFEHEFLEEGEEFATLIVQKMVEINNESSVDSLGMEITIDVEGEVVNPRVYHLESNSYIQIGTDSNPFTLEYGDELIISTVTNNKNVYLVRDGVKTNINEYIDENSTYIQLISGTNTISYTASSGEDNMRVLIKYLNKYLGV